MVDWIKNRVMERTSWDGGALIAVGLVGTVPWTLCKVCCTCSNRMGCSNYVEI